MSDRYLPIELNDLGAIGPQDQPGDIVLVDRAPHVSVLSLCAENGVKHVVQKSNISSATEIGFSSEMIQSPTSFFQYPLSCIFGQSSPDLQTEKRLARICTSVEQFSDRKAIISNFEKLVKSLTPSPALLNDVLLVVDETLSNAIYNAPFTVGTKKSPSNKNDDVTIDPRKKPLIFAGHDSERIVVGCRDSYGSLNIPELIRRIKGCYENNVGEMINFGEGGAGIGSFLMFNSCASMYIGVDSGYSTTIACSFPFNLSASKRSEMPKNIHLIQK